VFVTLEEALGYYYRDVCVTQQQVWDVCGTGEALVDLADTYCNTDTKLLECNRVQGKVTLNTVQIRVGDFLGDR